MNMHFQEISLQEFTRIHSRRELSCSPSKKQKHASSGFTLIEIMIVVAIIGVLTAAMVPATSQYMKRSRDSERLSNLTNVQLALDMYKSQNNVYPLSTTGASAGCVPTSVLTSGKYLTKNGTSPTSTTYNEGCGNNGQFGYGNKGGNGYILMGIMENAAGGNYSGSTAGFTGTVTASGIASLANIKKGIGNKYVLATESVVSTTNVTTTTIPVTGDCGILANSCDAGTSSGLTAGACGTSTTWVCKGANGGSDSPTCSAPNPPCFYNAVCGSASGTTTTTYPTANLCNPGTANGTDTTGTDGTYNWTCTGTGGGTNMSCSAPRYNTVTFNGNGGSGHTPTSKTIAHAAVVGTLPSNPTRAGYTFNGWYTATTGGTQVTASTPVNSSMTAYAHWTAITYTVSGTFGANGAGATVSVCGTNVTANASGNFSRTGIPHGTACNNITATRTSYTCTTSTNGPASLSANVTNIAGSCSAIVNMCVI